MLRKAGNAVYAVMLALSCAYRTRPMPGHPRPVIVRLRRHIHGLRGDTCQEDSPDGLPVLPVHPF